MKINCLVLLLIPCVIFITYENSIGTTIWANGVSQTSGWFDAEKDSDSTEDDELCWAASAANILAWSGWNAGYSTEDAIFDFFDAQTPIDVGGWQHYGWKFWFDGTENPGGYGHFVGSSHTGFYSTAEYNAALDQHWNDDHLAMAVAEDWLKNNYGVGLAVKSSAFYHAITLWGIDINDSTGEYEGMWITDSDNDKYGSDPRPNTINYYQVSYNDTDKVWEMPGYGGARIVEMDALRMNPIPEPGTIVLFALGLLAIGMRQGKKET